MLVINEEFQCILKENTRKGGLLDIHTSTEDLEIVPGPQLCKYYRLISLKSDSSSMNLLINNIFTEQNCSKPCPNSCKTCSWNTCNVYNWSGLNYWDLTGRKHHQQSQNINIFFGNLHNHYNCSREPTTLLSVEIIKLFLYRLVSFVLSCLNKIS